jgi:hypothetical protein
MKYTNIQRSDHERGKQANKKIRKKGKSKAQLM